jgi:NDP-sugar pyrophosphorylase family protein
MKAMILAAGYGQRLWPLTNILPKPLLPIVNKPALAWILEYLATFSIKEVMINLHHLAPLIPQTFGEGPFCGIRLHYSYEEELLGTAGALKKIEAFLQGGTFILFNADTLVELDLEKALAFHRTKGAMATLIVREDNEAANYGLLKIGPEGQLIEFLNHRSPTPAKTSRETMFSGIHILEPDIFNEIPPNCYCGFSEEVYPSMIRKGYPIYGYLYTGYWMDIGSPNRYLQANKDFLRKTGSSFSESIGKAREQIKISPPIAIGNNAILQEGCCLGPWTTLGDNCFLGRRSIIEESIAWNNVFIGEETYINNAILGTGVYLPPRTRIENQIVIRNQKNNELVVQPLSSNPFST